MMDSGRIVVTALGDSITSGAPRWDPNPEVRRELPPDLDEQSQWTYWAWTRDERLEFRNCGVNMQETPEIAARLEASVDGADVLVVQGGINDLVHDKPIDQAVDHLEAMVEKGKDLRLAVALAELVPNNNFPALDEPIRDLNERIRAIGRRHGVIVLPFYDALEDPENSFRMHPAWSDDGNHPSVDGHRRLGILAFRLPYDLSFGSR